MRKVTTESDSNSDYYLDSRNYLESWCAKCGEPGYYASPPGKWEEPYLIVCQSCGHEYCYLWCPECNAGGDFVQDATLHPSEWTCETCGRTYAIPAEIYNNPIPAHNEMTAPAPINEWIANRKKRYKTGSWLNRFQSPQVRIRWLAVAVVLASAVLFALIRLVASSRP